MQCSWQGGAVEIRARAWFYQASAGRYRHAIGLEAGIHRGRELVWVNAWTQIGDAADGDDVQLHATARTQKRGVWAQTTEDFGAVLAEAFSESRMPLVSSSRVGICTLQLPECEPIPSPEKAFECVVRVALYKLDFFDYEGIADRGTPLFDLPQLQPIAEEAAVEPEDDGEDAENGVADEPRRYWGLLGRGVRGA